MKTKTTYAGFTLIELLLVIVILGILIVIALNVINPARIQRRSYEAVHLSNASKICAALYACGNSSLLPTECNTHQQVGILPPTMSLGGVVPTYTYSVDTSKVIMVGSFNATTASKETTGAVTDPNRICVVSCTYNFADGTSTPATKNPVVTIGATTTTYTGCY